MTLYPAIEYCGQFNDGDAYFVFALFHRRKLISVDLRVDQKCLAKSSTFAWCLFDVIGLPTHACNYNQLLAQRSKSHSDKPNYNNDALI